jgi:hypothetical protein
MFSAIKKRRAFSISERINERRRIFVAELLKSGVEPQKAVEVAKIVADGIPDEQLTTEQMQLVQSACAKWLKERKRQQFINEVLQSFTS